MAAVGAEEPFQPLDVALDFLRVVYGEWLFQPPEPPVAAAAVDDGRGLGHVRSLIGELAQQALALFGQVLASARVEVYPQPSERLDIRLARPLVADLERVEVYVEVALAVLLAGPARCGVGVVERARR